MRPRHQGFESKIFRSCTITVSAEIFFADVSDNVYATVNYVGRYLTICRMLKSFPTIMHVGWIPVRAHTYVMLLYFSFCTF
jgi:hypothetical protein